METWTINLLLITGFILACAYWTYQHVKLSKRLRELHRHHRECLCGLPHCAKCRDDEEFERQIDELEAELRDYTQAAGAEAAEVDRRGARIAELEAREQRLRDGVRALIGEWQEVVDDTEEFSADEKKATFDCLGELRALLDDEREEPGDG